MKRTFKSLRSRRRIDLIDGSLRPSIVVRHFDLENATQVEDEGACEQGACEDREST